MREPRILGGGTYELDVQEHRDYAQAIITVRVRLDARIDDPENSNGVKYLMVSAEEVANVMNKGEILCGVILTALDEYEKRHAGIPA